MSKPKLSPEQRDILRECAERMEEIAQVPEPPKYPEWERREWQENRECGPRYLPSEWFCDGDEILPEKFRVRYLRALHALIEMELVEATYNGGQIHWIKLTEEGAKV